MSDKYYSLARELGGHILKSEQSLRLADALAENEGIESSQADYELLVEQVVGIIRETAGVAGNDRCGGCGGCPGKENGGG